MIHAESVNRAFSGWPLVAFAIVALTVSAVSYAVSIGCSASAGSGICFSTDAVRALAPGLSVALSCIVILASGGLLFWLNKTYLFVRSMTMVYVSVFFLLEAANPHLTATLTDGSLLTLIILGTLCIVFGTFGKRRSQRSVFITFFILSLVAMFHSASLYLVIVYLIGYVQMRVMKLRSFIAMLLGLALPLWLVFGFGIVGLSEFRWPAVQGLWTGNFSTIPLSAVISAGVLIIMMFALTTLNLVQIYSYKAQARAFNGFFIILAFLTIPVMIIDFGNILNYITILNMCVAIQVAHTFTISEAKYRYIALIALMLACAALYTIQIV